MAFWHFLRSQPRTLSLSGLASIALIGCSTERPRFADVNTAAANADAGPPDNADAAVDLTQDPNGEPRPDTIHRDAGGDSQSEPNSPQATPSDDAATAPTGETQGEIKTIPTDAQAPLDGCGDGVLPSDGTEACDDGNDASGDGCSSDCDIEQGWSCEEPATPCTPICGDGKLVGVEAAPGGCDDRGQVPGDGCDETCHVESNWSCTKDPSVCSPGCGNGIIESNEACDDGNEDNDDDGCHSCAVPSGWTCEDEPSLCVNIDECSMELDNCATNATCIDSVGTFDCACVAGYSGDGTTCSDVNECTEGTDNCDTNALCFNASGTFTCQCKSGYSGNGVTCNEVNECSEGTHNCDVNAACSNTTGSFSCECNPGHEGSGVTCTDVNECSQLTDNCHVLASCQNTAGSFTCTCDEGLAGDGTACAPPLVSVVTGVSHTCVLSDAGAVRCWGRNGQGQLGYGNTIAIGDDEYPSEAGDVTLTSSGEKAVALTAGGDHTCALLSDGVVRCWGHGAPALGYDHLDGIGDDETPLSAGDVAIGGEVTQISGGYDHTCAILITGALRCWGHGGGGELGYGDTSRVGGDSSSIEAAGDVDLGGVKAIHVAAGYFFTCVVLEGGAVKCWGHAADGQLGYGNTTELHAPLTNSSLSLGGTATQVVAGENHACALLSTGAVRCWGRGENGRLGYGNVNNIGDSESPSSVSAVEVGDKVVQLTAGRDHTCALLDTGALRCWGNGGHGALGYGNQNDIGDDDSPASAGDVPVGGSVSMVSAGFYYTCALLTGGTVRCWGSGADGQLGYGDTRSIGGSLTPDTVGDVPWY